VSGITHFGAEILLVALALALALAAGQLSARISIPAAALFLLGAALASDVFPALTISIGTVERLATVALVAILFDGGESIGRRRFRAAAVPIASLGILGTFAVAGAVAVFGHLALGLGWLTAGLLGAAVAPTDPAVVFSVLGEHRIAGRAGTILEGESGANDPVGIALMLGLIELATHADASFWIVVRVFCEQMAIGLAVGVAGGFALLRLLQRVTLPSSALTSIQMLAGAGIVYGVAAVCHGSGFLAVFVAGIGVGDARPRDGEAGVFREALSTLAEIVVFVALGLTIDLSDVRGRSWLDGLLVAAFLAVVARPVVAGALLRPVRLARGERLFVLWAGLKGAVPILLAAFALGRHVSDGQRLYDTVFVVVLASVVVQGGSVPYALRRLGVRTQAG
jgi:cell volume regulation protein A